MFRSWHAVPDVLLSLQNIQTNTSPFSFLGMSWVQLLQQSEMGAVVAAVRDLFGKRKGEKTHPGKVKVSASAHILPPLCGASRHTFCSCCAGPPSICCVIPPSTHSAPAVWCPPGICNCTGCQHRRAGSTKGRSGSVGRGSCRCTDCELLTKSGWDGHQSGPEHTIAGSDLTWAITP